MKTLIYNAEIVNEGRRFRGALLIDGERIAEVYEGEVPIPVGIHGDMSLQTIDAQGAMLLPGIIDTHVHFREPGLTHKADIRSESLAAAAGGVTTVMDMPNVSPPTTTIRRWQEKMELGQRESAVNYLCYLGATNDNIEEIRRAADHGVPAIKVFMGSSTGNMLVDRHEALRDIFRAAAENGLPIVAHCEDTRRINERMTEAQALWGDDPAVEHHPWIRDAEACLRSSSLAAQLAHETGARLHIAHVTTERELGSLPSKEGWDGTLSLEVCVPHLLFSDEDYPRLGTRIKCNPAIKTRADRDALRRAVADGRILTIATDHAPHLLAEKQGGCRRAASGMPMVQFSLIAMLGLADEGVLRVERMVDAMCHQPALLFHIKERGFLRPGYKADFVLVRRKEWTLRCEEVRSKCGWSPLESHTFSWKVWQTFVGGQQIYKDPS